MIRKIGKFVTGFLLISSFIYGEGVEKNMENKIMDKEKFEKINVFGTGKPNDAYAQYFVGSSFLKRQEYHQSFWQM